jgi:hypothetical protein
VCIIDEMIILANVLENTFQVHIREFIIQNTNTKSEYQYVLPHVITFMKRHPQYISSVHFSQKASGFGA